MSKKPGSNTGKNGGIFQETGPRGGHKDNYATVPDHHRLPPTSKPGHTWEQVKGRRTAKSRFHKPHSPINS